jgi:hypothetical protein
MAEQERATHGEKEKADQKHRPKQQESQPVFDRSHEWDQGPLSLTETPFHPQMDEHAAILSRIPFTAQRHEFIMQLNNTYGNRYVQRLMESMNVQAKLTVSDPNDVYEKEADRVAEAVTRAVQTPVSRQEEEEEMQMKPVLQRQEGQKKGTNTGPSMDHSTILGQKIQRVERDETGNIVELDMATCSLVGVAHEKMKSFATVKSEAWMSTPTHSVVYEIKWDAAVVPGGHHLGQVAGQASDWVVDKSKDDEPIGDRGNMKMNAPYFKNDLNWEHDPEAGRYFYYHDPIQQRRLRGGSWWFRLKVVDKKGSVLSQSHDVEVPWGE